MLSGLFGSLLYLALEIQHSGFMFAALAGFLVIGFDADPDSQARPVYMLIGVAGAAPFLAYLATPHLAAGAGVDLNKVDPSPLFLLADIAAAAGGIWLAFWYLRNGVHLLEDLLGRKTKRSSLERNRRTDIREIEKFLPSSRARFDPLKHIDFKKGIFVGRDEDDKPVYISSSDWDVSHVLLSGRTRSGKGVAAQILGCQSIRLGELFVVLDPKCDSWMPHIYRDECMRSGKPWVLLDLRPSAPPQINLSQGASAESLESVFIGGFSLTEKGDNADFYRLGDRAAARAAAAHLAKYPGDTLADIVKTNSEAWSESAAGFLAGMRELAELPAVNRVGGGGIDLHALAESGGCLYVIGDMLNTRIVRVQRMILLLLLEIARTRESIDETPRIIRVFADEFRVHISRPFIVSLGASAGWRLLSLLAFQSFGDLRDCPADLDPDLIQQATMENCAIQLSYRIKDPETAEILAASTGQILVDDESRKTSRNLAMSETVAGERTLRQADRYLVDVNMITHLPVPDPTAGTIGCGVLIGAGPLAQFCFTSPVAACRTKEGITPTTPPQNAPVAVAEDAPAWMRGGVIESPYNAAGERSAADAIELPDV